MPPKILIVADWYLPGYKAGGLVTSLANVVESLGESFEFFVITRDRDLTDAQPYSGVQRNEWVSTGKAMVLYTADISFPHLRRRILELAPDIIYLNSFFSVLTIKTLCMRILGLLPGCGIILAPRGEFSPGALNLKRRRKWLYRNLALRGGLYHDLVWHASSELEQEHTDAMLRKMGLKQPCIHVAWESPSPDWLRTTNGPAKPAKAPGAARFLFLSRISPMKNLLFALSVLGELTGHLECDVVGPIDDHTYWQECEKRAKTLPVNVSVGYRGAIPHESVPRVAEGYHFFVLPSLGENFGYAILEAMAAGCPVVVSDRTPWQDVQARGAGWYLPLENRELWRCVLQQCVDMDQNAYQTLSLRTRQYVAEWSISNRHYEETVRLFRLALARGNSPRFPSSFPETEDPVGGAPRNVPRGGGPIVVGTDHENLSASHSNSFERGKP
jgi:glycosyltransferase involved in cell wall biosynthesis